MHPDLQVSTGFPESTDVMDQLEEPEMTDQQECQERPVHRARLDCPESRASLGLKEYPGIKESSESRESKVEALLMERRDSREREDLWDSQDPKDHLDHELEMENLEQMGHTDQRDPEASRENLALVDPPVRKVLRGSQVYQARKEAGEMLAYQEFLVLQERMEMLALMGHVEIWENQEIQEKRESLDSRVLQVTKVGKDTTVGGDCKANEENRVMVALMELKESSDQVDTTADGVALVPTVSPDLLDHVVWMAAKDWTVEEDGQERTDLPEQPDPQGPQDHQEAPFPSSFHNFHNRKMARPISGELTLTLETTLDWEATLVYTLHSHFTSLRRTPNQL